jgi:hypothetical protein
MNQRTVENAPDDTTGALGPQLYREDIEMWAKCLQKSNNAYRNILDKNCLFFLKGIILI